ncbi:aldehyde dehydrogenase family 2 member C4-like protein [Tanacetum coccineum]
MAAWIIEKALEVALAGLKALAPGLLAKAAELLAKAAPKVVREARFSISEYVYISDTLLFRMHPFNVWNDSSKKEEVIASIAEGDKEDIDLAVKAAREAFDHGLWPHLSSFERGRIMMKFLQLAEENIEELSSGRLLRFHLHSAYLGVVGHTIPGNFLIEMFLMKTSPALAAGCTMLVKPAEQSPLSALYLAYLAKLAGIPDGVINVVTEFGETAGAAIGSHMDIDSVSFTGSTEIGRVVMQAAPTSNLKAVSLEQCS